MRVLPIDEVNITEERNFSEFKLNYHIVIIISYKKIKTLSESRFSLFMAAFSKTRQWFFVRIGQTESKWLPVVRIVLTEHFKWRKFEAFY